MYRSPNLAATVDCSFTLYLARRAHVLCVVSLTNYFLLLLYVQLRRPLIFLVLIVLLFWVLLRAFLRTKVVPKTFSIASGISCF